MGLFDVFKKAPVPAPVRVYSFTNTKNFRGFKKFAMEVNLDPAARDNNLSFRDADVTGAQIDFYDVAPDRINVHLNGVYIGYIYKQDGLDALRSGRIMDFHVKFEEDHVFDANHEEWRFRAHLLAKYKDNF